MPRRRYKMTDAELKEYIESLKIIDISGCWLWTGSKFTNGYGVIQYNKKVHRVHKIYWILSGRIIPDGLYLCHGPECVGKKHCFNPDHLRPATPHENNMDMHRDGTTTSKLIAIQVLEIRALTGLTQRQIADKYNVGQMTISNIITRETWGHI